MSKFKRRFNFTEAGPKHAQLLFFHLNESSPFCVLGPLPEKSHERPRQSGFIRFSSDLGLVGLFENNRVSVYPISQCKERSERLGNPGTGNPGGNPGTDESQGPTCRSLYLHGLPGDEDHGPGF